MKSSGKLDLSKFLEHCNPTSVISSFYTPYVSRYQMELLASGEKTTHTDYHEIIYDGDESVEHVIEWLAGLALLSPARDKKIGTLGYDGEWGASWSTERPVTEEEVAAAKKWLEDNPKRPNETIKFRPMKVFDDLDNWPKG